MDSETVNLESSASDPDLHFEQIYNYKFEKNAKFLEGWKKVKNVIPKDKILDSLIKAQTFFFSREVCSVDYTEYRSWLTAKGKDMHCYESLVADEPFLPPETLKPEISNSNPSSSVSEQDQVLSKGISVKVDSGNENSDTETNADDIEIEKRASVIETQQNIQHEDSDHAKEEDSDHSKEVVKHPVNFIELVEMIQAGIKLPDTDDLDIQPLNEDPTPCDIQRPKKPWDVS